MKKLLIIITLLVSAVSFSKAQGGGPQGTPAERAQRTVDGPALASLTLTADQKTKTVALLTKVNVSSDSLRAAANGDFAAIGAKSAPINAAAEKTFVSWLTADQKKAYDTALAAAKAQNPNATGILVRGRRPQ